RHSKFVENVGLKCDFVLFNWLDHTKRSNIYNKASIYVWRHSAEPEGVPMDLRIPRMFVRYRNPKHGRGITHRNWNRISFPGAAAALPASSGQSNLIQYFLFQHDLSKSERVFVQITT